MLRRVALIALIALLVAGASTTTRAATAASSVGHADWSTYYHRSERSGFSSDAPASPQSVRRQWRSPRLDGEVYAQPLVVGTRVIVATESNTVYSLRVADGTIAWRHHLANSVPATLLPCGNVDPVGITGTPVVDVGARRIYAVGLVRPPLRHVLFELDVVTGRLIDTAVVNGGGDPKVHNQRGALALTAGKVFIPYGGRTGDCGDYHGRVVSVAASRTGLGAVDAFTLPTQNRGGFWAPPGAVVAGNGSLYLASGNSSSNGNYDYGNSVVRISTSLRLLDAFAPSNWRFLNSVDLDLGTTSPVLLPNHHVFQVGKEGIGYLLDADHLGGPGGELSAHGVCPDHAAFGGVAHDRHRLFVPCSTKIVAIEFHADGFRVAWKSPISNPGPTIVTPGAVWSVANGTGELVAFDPSSGQQLAIWQIGQTPSRFTSPAAGDGRIFVAAGRRLLAFGR
jgi:outer membrane protein assembly factor BamB